ncbi:putative nucleotidyltransferase, ribonuclease H [Tanacetum coccineum]
MISGMVAGPSGGSGGGGCLIPQGIYVWIKRFTKLKPLAFLSAATPAEVEDWITHMKKLFQVLGCPDNFKTHLAAFKLEGDALSWWKAHLRTQQRYEREYGSICQLDQENSGEYMERFTRLASFVAAAARNIELLHESGNSNKRDRDGNRIQNRGQGQTGDKEWGLIDRPGSGLTTTRPHRSQSTRDFNQGHASGSAGQRRSTETLPPPPLCEGLSPWEQKRVAADFARLLLLQDGFMLRLVIRRSTGLQSVKLISAMKARTLISHGCQGFLASVMDTSLESPNIENLSIVREFADVFPDELPGLLGREIEFGIELNSRTWHSEERDPSKDLIETTGVCSEMTSDPSCSVAFQIYSDASKKGLGWLVLIDRGSWFCALNDLIGYVFLTDQALREKVMTELIGLHLLSSRGSTKRYRDLKQSFGGTDGMKQDVATFVSKCMTCQQVKIEHQRASGLLQPLEIPMWKWDEISMDFVTGLPTTQKRHDAIWVVVDRLTKSAHFLPIRKNYGISKLAEIFRQEIVRLHGTPTSIVSDRDPKFTSRFWKGLQKAWGTRLKFSTAFHPQTDGQSERTIQTLEDMLRACALEWTGSWDEYLCLVEFAYNNSWHASIKAAPFELLYGRKCRAPICWDEVGERLIEGPELIEITNEKVAVAKEKLKEARSRQKSYADKHRRDLEFQVGDRVFLKVSPFRGVKRFGIKGKLSPRFIGPFEILERIGEVSYRLALPPQLSHVHDVFHVSLLRGYHYHPLHVASYPFDQIQPDMSLSEEPESILDRQERVMRNKVIPFVKILWKNHPEREATWETEESMRASYPHFFV